MRGAAIANKKDRALGAGGPALQELNEDSGVDAVFFLDHEPHVTARRDRGNQLRGCRAPVAWTIGVSPFLPQVRPVR